MTSPIRIMLVDDSSIIRGLIARALEKEPDFRIVATASNGQEALDALTSNPIDVIVLDIEMPIMDGITALPLLLKKAPRAKVIMASMLSERNADISMHALSLGASDYMPKPNSRSDVGAQMAFFRELVNKVRVLGAAQPVETPSTIAPPVALPPVTVKGGRPEAIAIGSSTGGPQALMTLFQGLKGRMPNVPVFLTQHMPPTFTTLLAQRIGEAVGLPCTEGHDGEAVKAQHIYVAPGDYHMTVKCDGDHLSLAVDQGPQENFCRPAVDPMLRSLVSAYGDRLLVVILTGMGSDGMLGCKVVAASGGTIVAQDEETSVVWGMPGAVAKENLATVILPLDRIADYVVKACEGVV